MTDTEKVGPVDHITRAVLPWRIEADLTECGKPLTDLAGRLVTREEAAARIKRIGQQRAAYTLCLTCAGTSDRRNRSEPADAAAIIFRVTEGLRYAAAPLPFVQYEGSERLAARRQRAEREWAERQRFNVEVEAIVALIAAHREEFDGYLSGREQTVSLAERRGQRRTTVRDFTKGRPL